MEKSKIITIINKSQNQLLLTTGIKRDYEDEIGNLIGSKPIKIITGFRRSGKSFLLQQILKKQILTKKVKLENILYLNFENLELSSINSAEKLADFYEVFLHSVSSEGNKIIAFDEIQQVTNWDKFIRTIYEMKTSKKNDVEIIITGSNSELLSSEIGSNLAGRFIEFFILPFSFKETLEYFNIHITSEKEYYRNQSELKKIFYEYLKYGGLPEVFYISQEKAKYSYLEGIVNKVILDDVINRFDVKHSYLIEKILQYQLISIGNKISYSRVKNFIEELGYKIKQDTAYSYVQYCLKCFALFEVNKFDWKTKRIFSGLKKYYAIDSGIANLYQGVNNNFSKLLENIVYLQLKRFDNTKNIYYFDNNREIDFLAELRDRTFIKYQVTQELNKKNEERELSAFISDDKHLNKYKNILLTLDDDEKAFTYKKTKIQTYNLIKWLLAINKK